MSRDRQTAVAGLRAQLRARQREQSTTWSTARVCSGVAGPELGGEHAERVCQGLMIGTGAMQSAVFHAVRSCQVVREATHPRHLRHGFPRREVRKTRHERWSRGLSEQAFRRGVVDTFLGDRPSSAMRLRQWCSSEERERSIRAPLIFACRSRPRHRACVNRVQN
jgi:hypothetical protein